MEIKERAIQYFKKNPGVIPVCEICKHCNYCKDAFTDLADNCTAAEVENNEW